MIKNQQLKQSLKVLLPAIRNLSSPQEVSKEVVVQRKSRMEKLKQWLRKITVLIKRDNESVGDGDIAPSRVDNLYDFIGGDASFLSSDLDPIESLFVDGTNVLVTRLFCSIPVALGIRFMFCRETGADPKSVFVVKKIHKLNDGPKTDYYFRTEAMLLFREDLSKKFDEWFAKYSTRYHDSSDVCTIIPEIPTGVRVNHIPVEHGEHYNYHVPYCERDGYRVPTEELMNQWSWIVNNCEGKAFVTPDHWLFEIEEEAMHFKLIWGN